METIVKSNVGVDCEDKVVIKQMHVAVEVAEVAKRSLIMQAKVSLVFLSHIVI